MLPLPWAMQNPFARADKKAAEGPQPPMQQKQSADPLKDQNDPANKALQNKGANGDDPIANLDSLWQPNVDKDGKEIPEDNDTGTYLPNLDSKKLQAMVDKMDFTTGITKEEINAIKAGGEESLGAFANMLNRAGRKSFITAFQASSKLAEQGFTRAQDRFMKNIPGQVRDMMVDNGLDDAVGITQNPLFKPLVTDVKNRFLKKWPKANPAQISAGVKKYFDTLETEFASNKQKNVKVDDPSQKLRKGDANADFEAWLGDEINGLKSNVFSNADTDPDFDSQQQ